jgi:hypothetical protein
MLRTLYELTRDMPKEKFEVLVAFALNLLFLVLIALLLWPLDRTILAVRLVKGYGVLWIVVCVAFVTMAWIQRMLRVDMYSRFDAFVAMNLSVTVLLVAGWSAYAALTVRSLVESTPVWMAVILYLVGLLSSYIAFVVTTAFYQGHIYKLAALPLAGASFVVFAIWPSVGRMSYGWFLGLF